MVKCEMEIHLFCDVCESKLIGNVVQGDIVYVQRCDECLTANYNLGFNEAMKIEKKKVDELVKILEETK